MKIHAVFDVIWTKNLSLMFTHIFEAIFGEKRAKFDKFIFYCVVCKHYAIFSFTKKHISLCFPLSIKHRIVFVSVKWLHCTSFLEKVLRIRFLKQLNVFLVDIPGHFERVMSTNNNVGYWRTALLLRLHAAACSRLSSAAAGCSMLLYYSGRPKCQAQRAVDPSTALFVDIIGAFLVYGVFAHAVLSQILLDRASKIMGYIVHNSISPTFHFTAFFFDKTD